MSLTENNKTALRIALERYQKAKTHENERKQALRIDIIEIIVIIICIILVVVLSVI